ncbi:NLP/P60 hydrolase [Rhodobacteraceae bacterium CCMM004]|nr:NLP/P60 hydrolase [Rhodobacteraceae bacterium CCMM004]
MTRDRRRTPANGRVAATALRGEVAAERFTDGERRQVAVPVLDLFPAPGADVRERQLLYGAEVTVYEEIDGRAFVAAAADGYVGYVDATALGPASRATHIVSVPATHLYALPEVKSQGGPLLSFGSRVRVVSASGDFFETDTGDFVPKPHVRPAALPFTDPVAVAQLFFGAPYRWGGNAIGGIDCSGLVQAACRAADIPCPGDSDQQQAEAGTPLPPGTTPRRGDLIFWKGHVAIAVDAEVMIHANAHHMAVAYEPVAEGTARIAEQGEGPVVALRRLHPPIAAADRSP